MKRLIAWAAMAALLLMAAQGNAQNSIPTGSTTVGDTSVIWIDTLVQAGSGNLLDGFPDSVMAVEYIITGYFDWQPIGDTVWYYRMPGVDISTLDIIRDSILRAAEVDSATTIRALDSMIEIPGIWQDNDNPLKTLPEGAVYPSPNKLTIDPAMIYHGKVTIDTTEPHYNEFYYLDPQTGYFHRPDGVYEAVPDSEYAGYVGDYDMYYYGRWKHILKWRKVEER